MSQSEIEEELYKEALRHASSESKHSKRKIELITRRLQLLAAMEQHMQKYRAQACLLDNLVETFFTLGVRVSSNLETKCSHAVHPPSKENEHDMGRRDECCTLQGKMVQIPPPWKMWAGFGQETPGLRKGPTPACSDPDALPSATGWMI
ncbi:hypothetical protein AOLI_G00323150 [Acnodon oligacanthus]